LTPEVEFLEVELDLDYPSRLDTSPQDVLNGWHVRRLTQAFQAI